MPFLFPIEEYVLLKCPWSNDWDAGDDLFTTKTLYWFEAFCIPFPPGAWRERKVLHASISWEMFVFEELGNTDVADAGARHVPCLDTLRHILSSQMIWIQSPQATLSLGAPMQCSAMTSSVGKPRPM